MKCSLIMSRIFYSLIALFISNLCFQVTAQSKSYPCDTKKHKEFDFWVGDWNVYNSNNNLIGTNNILKMQSNCVLQENWKSETSISRGTSYNYVDLVDKTWNQVWVDNSGFSLILKGNLSGKSMVLKSDFVKGQQGEYYNKVTWTPNKDGSVTQVWEYISRENKVIQEAFIESPLNEVNKFWHHFSTLAF